MERVPRRATPAALLLGLVLFALLQFVAASCEAPPEPGKAPVTIGVSYTGTDLVTAHTQVDIAGGLHPSPAQLANIDEVYAVTPVVQWSAIGTALVLLVGALLCLAGGPVRAAVAALAATVSLVVTALLAHGMVAAFAAEVLAISAQLPGVDAPQMESRIGEVIATGPGFWLPLALVVAVLALDATVLVRARSADG